MSNSLHKDRQRASRIHLYRQIFGSFRRMRWYKTFQDFLLECLVDCILGKYSNGNFFDVSWVDLSENDIRFWFFGLLCLGEPHIFHRDLVMLLLGRCRNGKYFQKILFFKGRFVLSVLSNFSSSLMKKYLLEP